MSTSRLALSLALALAALGRASAGDAPVGPHQPGVREPAFPLYPKGAPGALGTDPKKDIPTLAVYLPPADKATGAAVVVCPGGGYGGLADHEGHPIAEWLNSVGVAGIVLKYRVAPYKHPVPLQDAQHAVRTVRARAADWKLDPGRVGILGFSAGGHLASSAATHFDDGKADAEDPADKPSCRPDLAILIYPVITMSDPYTHKGSRNNLLGGSPPAELVDLMSNEKQVTPKTPPCFIVFGSNDRVVPVENGLMFAEALSKAKVPFDLHVYEDGPHGFGLRGKGPIGQWPETCAAWFERRGFLKK
jgi:acetyl esterase/lipase